MTLLFALATAWGAEIQVEAVRPVVVAINGRPAAFAGTRIDTHDLEPGLHHVQVRSFVGLLLAETVVRVSDDERVQLVYDRDERTLTEMDRAKLVSSVEPEPIEALVQPEPVGTLPGALAPAPSASLVVTGISDVSGTVTVAGSDVMFSSSATPRGFLATAIPDPVVEVHIEDNGRLRFHGAVDVVDGQNQVCHLHFRQTAWSLKCEPSGPEIR